MSPKIKFENFENKLIAKLCTEKPYPFLLGELYPHVKSIGRYAISPDIDILQIISAHGLIVGYEAKWLHYSNKTKRTSWNRFYQGIGQVLCYFLHGVHHAYLVLGWNNLPEKDVSKILNHFEILTKFVATKLLRKDILSRRIIPPNLLFEAPIYRCLGLIAFDKATSQCYRKGDPIENRLEKFPIDSIEDNALRNEVETKRVNLLAKKPNFKWDGKFLEKCKISMHA